MTPLDHRCNPVRPLLVEVETSPGSGNFAVDERLRADEVTLGSDALIASAAVSVRLDNDFDAAAARDRYLPDRRLIVRTDHPDAAQRTVLFDGYPLVQEARWAGGPGNARDTYTLVAHGVYDVLSRDRRAWIYGRRMRNGRIDDGLSSDPGAWKSQSVLVEALPCVFNPDGEGNCSPTPLEVAAPDGSVRLIHVFTYDNAAAAIRWTCLSALRYLVWFHRPPAGPVAEGNVFAATNAYTDLPANPPADRIPDSGLARCLTMAPASLNCEATNLVEALALLADACGIHVTPAAVNDAGQPRTGLHVWSGADATEESLALAWGGRHADGSPRYDAAAGSAADVFEANEIHQALVRWDSRRIVNAPIVIGDVRRYEMTVPLAPGWMPETNLDNVAEPDRAAAKALALTPDQVEIMEDPETSQWYRRYHSNGSEFEAYRDVSRKWVLNEDGRYGSVYNRNVPFDDYRPFDFSTVADDSITTPGAWTRRLRPFQTTITRTTDGDGFGVHVEVSFDGGSTWHRPQGSVRILSDPTGVYFAVANPTSIRPPDTEPEAQNMWYAIIDQTFRVRATAVFDADERLLVDRSPDGAATPTLRTVSRVVYRPSRYKYQSRRGTTDVLAGVNPDATDIDHDDAPAAAALADTIARQEQDERVLVTPAIPWLDTRLAIGMRIGGIPGRRVGLGGRVSCEPDGPVIVGKHYRVSNGRYETRLVLEYTDLQT